MADSTPDQTLAAAVKMHQAGRLAEAEQIYRTILQRSPDEAAVLHLLGLIAHQRGDNAAAEELIRRAIACSPDVADFHKNLGRVLAARGNPGEGLASYRRAAALRPGDYDAHLGAAVLLSQMNRLDEAIAAYEQSLAIQPGQRDAWIRLAQLLVQRGNLQGARIKYETALQHWPESAELLSNYGSVLKDIGLVPAAILAYRKALGLLPGSPLILANLGVALAQAGQREEAIAVLKRAAAGEPNSAAARGRLGRVLLDFGFREEALAEFQAAAALEPAAAQRHRDIAEALGTLDRSDEALPAHRRAVELSPESGAAQQGLGLSLRDLGRFDEAMEALGRAVKLEPGNARIGSSMVITSLYHPGLDTPAIRRIELEWDERYAKPLRSSIRAHDNSRDPQRRLKIGYVSADFSAHVVGRNVLPLFREHDHGRYEIFCYSNGSGPGAMTDRFKSYADHWIEIGAMTDEAAAERIRSDKIDILVDLALHTVNHRLLIFARKPAPVQMCFAGYPGGTGLRTMDYRISDPYLDPPDGEENEPLERVLRLADCFWCFDPDAMDVAKGFDVGPLPALSAGSITFGSLNVPFKMNDEVLALWARVMQRVPSSRLIMLALVGPIRERILRKFSDAGVDPSRVELVGRRPREQYLRLYERIDLGLDTVPYNSHSTGLESLWMGVPIVTLVGRTTVGRAGYSHLSNLGLRDLIATDRDQFVEIAVKTAGDLPRLAELRRTLRGRMLASPLCDARRFARNVETAFRTAWGEWCGRSVQS